MKRPTVAVLFGGRSSEYSVSLHSAQAVLTNLDPARYQAVPIGISQEGKWFHYTGPYESLAQDTWQEEAAHLTPVAVSPDPALHGLLRLPSDRVEPLPLDCALPILHGKNGEDGTVQGLFQLAGVPVAGCGVLASALCMDKDRAHRLAAQAGVDVPRALVLSPGEDPRRAQYFALSVGYPLFVKPVKGGSSHGITKVTQAADLTAAIHLAFQHDDQVILEEAIPGFEVGCAVLGTDALTVGEIDEIELTQGFFDFTEKYSLVTSAIHVPARVSSQTARRVKETAKRVYKALGCSGFARVDCFVTPQGRIVFNEVNTIPGFTEHSRFPGMMAAAGWTFPALLDAILKEAMGL